MKITASDLATHAFCRRKAYYAKNRPRLAAPDSDHMIRRKNEGLAAHSRMERQVQDKRCFVASWACGHDHMATQQLRDFRDRTLLRSAFGRAFVRAYYAASPVLISTFGLAPGARTLARWCVIKIAAAIKGGLK
jgi:hypothetical protein